MVILAAGAPSDAFSLISLPSLVQARHGTYQSKTDFSFKIVLLTGIDIGLRQFSFSVQLGLHQDELGFRLKYNQFDIRFMV